MPPHFFFQLKYDTWLIPALQQLSAIRALLQNERRKPRCIHRPSLRPAELKGRTRRIAIVAMARKLLIALWRFTEDGEIPAGAIMRAA